MAVNNPFVKLAQKLLYPVRQFQDAMALINAATAEPPLFAAAQDISHLETVVVGEAATKMTAYVPADPLPYYTATQIALRYYCTDGGKRTPTTGIYMQLRRGLSRGDKPDAYTESHYFLLNQMPDDGGSEHLPCLFNKLPLWDKNDAAVRSTLARNIPSVSASSWAREEIDNPALRLQPLPNAMTLPKNEFGSPQDKGRQIEGFVAKDPLSLYQAQFVVREDPDAYGSVSNETLPRYNAYLRVTRNAPGMDVPPHISHILTHRVGSDEMKGTLLAQWRKDPDFVQSTLAKYLPSVKLEVWKLPRMAARELS